MPPAITVILSSSSAGKSGSLAVGLLQGDPHGNEEWEAALSAERCELPRLRVPAEGCVVLCRDLLCASWVSGCESQPQRGQSPPTLFSASECDPVCPALPAQAPEALSCETLPGTSVLALVRSCLVSSRPRWLPRVLLAGPLCSELATQRSPG